MNKAQTLDEFDRNWLDFLHSIERTWTKALHKYKKEDGWESIKSQYKKLRESDELLRYLCQARGSDQHTVEEIVSRKDSGLFINAAEGNSLHIDRMVIGPNQLIVDSKQALRIDFLPGKTKLLPVVMRGVTTPVPTTHMGKALDPENIVELAQLGATFYEGFLDEAERTLGK